MPRKGKVKTRKTHSDSLYNSERVQRFINRLMRKGKKSTAEKICYGALDILKDKIKKQPLEIFEEVLKTAQPRIEVKARRVGGATYQVPIEVSPRRAEALATRWIIGFARARGGKSMIDKLAAEMQDILNNTGSTIKKRVDTHKMADANKAFAHYRW